jgi:hypothetical protein
MLFDICKLRLRIVALLDACKETPDNKKKHEPPPPELVVVVEMIIQEIKGKRAEDASHARVVKISRENHEDFMIPCLRAASIFNIAKHDDDLEMLGSGHFGSVVKIQLPKNKTKKASGRNEEREDRAVKIVKLSSTSWFKQSFEHNFNAWHTEVMHACTASDLNVGPHIYNAFVCKQPGESYGFMVMDVVKGVTLATWRKEQKPKDVENANKIAMQKIKKLHSVGIFHGDLHAGNILVVPNPKDPNTVNDVLIVDYGFTQDVSQLCEQDIYEFVHLVDGRREVVSEKEVAWKISVLLMKEGACSG